MRFPRILLAGVIASVVLSSCTNSEDLNPQLENSLLDLNQQVDKKQVAFDLIDLMKNQSFKTNTLHLLEHQEPSVAMSKVLSESKASVEKMKSYQELLKKTTYLESVSSEEAPDKIEILELWMMNSKKSKDFSNILFSFAPEGDESTWSVIEAYNMNKEVVYLDVNKAPNQPVIVIETNGFETLKREVELMNEYLRDAGVQNSRFQKVEKDLSYQSSKSSGLETTKLDKIRLNDDEEPWISGAAEVYAITSGIKDSDNSPEIKVIPMYYLDHDGRDYYPNQILLFWDDYQYQAANIQLFEKDDNVNYKDLVSTIVNGVFQIIGTVSTQPWVNVLGQVAGAIIQAMPNQWYTNNDDYVDSFYTIEKNKSYSNYYGARGNAKVNLSPFFVASN
ncbi:DUF3103 family protein [Tenacibaculum sp. 190524A05c]|uniref:DUF3103 family protein n=1 Tax=Tenacibaculum platacis TaxID=3137852 RepID=A0ABP1ED91_9FLAO